MAVFNAAFPVLPGKEGAARAFAKEVAGARRADFEAAERDARITRETWSLQETPMGTFVLVWFDGDVEAAVGSLASKNDEFTKWFRGQVQELSGVDMAADDTPVPEVILDWSG